MTDNKLATDEARRAAQHEVSGTEREVARARGAARVSQFIDYTGVLRIAAHRKTEI